MINQTIQQYNEVAARCKSIFVKKNQDYGPSWRIMRVSSITDQIFIKANRIRTIEEKGTQQIDEGVESEFMGIINYCIMALIQLELGTDSNTPDEKTLEELYNQKLMETRNLMEMKNHDYGEIWRNMLISTFTDMLLMRVNRIHQILGNKGSTLVSEGVESNFMDMINYSVFALIRIEESKNSKSLNT